jgi:hypothetical protein
MKYCAFVSNNRADVAAAKWLQRRISLQVSVPLVIFTIFSAR